MYAEAQHPFCYLTSEVYITTSNVLLVNHLHLTRRKLHEMQFGWIRYQKDFKNKSLYQPDFIAVGLVICFPENNTRLIYHVLTLWVNYSCCLSVCLLSVKCYCCFVNLTNKARDVGLILPCVLKFFIQTTNTIANNDNIVHSLPRCY